MSGDAAGMSACATRKGGRRGGTGEDKRPGRAGAARTGGGGRGRQECLRQKEVGKEAGNRGGQARGPAASRAYRLVGWTGTLLRVLAQPVAEGIAIEND